MCSTLYASSSSKQTIRVHENAVNLLPPDKQGFSSLLRNAAAADVGSFSQPTVSSFKDANSPTIEPRYRGDWICRDMEENGQSSLCLLLLSDLSTDVVKDKIDDFWHGLSLRRRSYG